MYTILAVGILSIPVMLNTVQAQSNMTGQASSQQNQTSSQNKTVSKDIQALMTVDLAKMKENLMNAKTALVSGNPQETLGIISDIENQLLLLQDKPSFTKDIPTIRESISKNDTNQALDDITKLQTSLLTAETEIFKAQMSNPQLMSSIPQQDMSSDEPPDDEDDDDTDTGDSSD